MFFSILPLMDYTPPDFFAPNFLAMPDEEFEEESEWEEGYSKIFPSRSILERSFKEGSKLMNKMMEWPDTSYAFVILGVIIVHTGVSIPEKVRIKIIDSAQKILKSNNAKYSKFFSNPKPREAIEYLIKKLGNYKPGTVGPWL